MKSGTVVKVIAAFVSGLVVALGSALIYVRVADQHHGPVTENPAVLSAIPKEPPQEIAETTVPTESHSSVQISESKQPKAQQRPIKKALRHVPTETTHKPVQIARAEPPARVYVPPADTVNPPLPAQTTPEEQANVPATTPDPAPEPPPFVPPTPQPHIVTLAAGTVVFVRLGETLSTEHNYTGDTFRATLLSPIIQDGFIIADRGSKVLGCIMNSQSAGHMASVAGLALELTEINTTDGQRVRIATTTFERRGPSNVGPDAAKIAGGAALGALIGGLADGGKGAAIGAGAGGAAGAGAVLLTHGKAAIVQSETQMTFRLAKPVTIIEKLN